MSCSLSDYEFVLVLGGGNTGLSMGHQSSLVAEEVFICGTEGHPGKTVDVVKAGSQINAQTSVHVTTNVLPIDYVLKLEYKSHVKVGDLQRALLGRMTSKRVLIVVCTTIDVHGDVAKELRKCNLSDCDIIAHPGFFLGHYLNAQTIEPARRPGEIYLTDVTIFASRAGDAGEVTLSGKKNGLEVSRFGGEVSDAQRQLVADFFKVDKEGITPTDIVTMLANVANLYAHLIKTLDQLERIAAGERFAFYRGNSKEVHDESEAFAAEMQQGWAQIGVVMRKFMDKVNGMYPGPDFGSFDEFCNNSTAHVDIPASSSTDTRTLWEEWVFLGLFGEIFARFGVVVPRLDKYYAEATAAIEKYCPHRLAKKITLSDLHLAELPNDKLLAGLNGVF